MNCRTLIPQLLQRFTALWWECDTDTPLLLPTYTAREQAAREVCLEHFLDALTAEIEHPPHAGSERQSTQERILSAFDTFARSALDLEDRHLDVLLARGLPQAATAFAREARRFDPALGGEEIFQAGRNAVAMNGLQLLLGLPAELTPAIFAYSLIYPYTDNFLDDPTIPIEAKTGFNRHLARRLAGEDLPPANVHERLVFDLVGMIERQFDRAHHPLVFESLSAIHRAR